MTPSQRLKILRILHGLTQESLARESNVSRASVLGWEKKQLPARRAAETLARILEVNTEYLLSGVNPPAYGVWNPISPGHPKHIPTLVDDLKRGISLLFKELVIDFGVKGTMPGRTFWLCGNSPENREWKLNFLITYETSLDPIISNAIGQSVEVHNIGFIDTSGINGEFISEISENLKSSCANYPNVAALYERLGGFQSEGDADFSLEFLLKEFGHLIDDNDMSPNDIDTIAHFIANSIAKRGGSTNTRWSSRELIRSAVQHAKKPKQ